MPCKLPRVQPRPRSGSEPFKRGDSPLGTTTLQDYWLWSGSDLLSNVERGVLAEFLVASALGLTAEVREEWGAFDLEMLGRTIEVKSAAYIQSWKQKCFSKISFDIARRKFSWNPKTGEYDELTPPKRVADVYVFCLLNHKEQDTINPLDVEQWVFYVVPTSLLDCKRSDSRSIGLGPLERLAKSGVEAAAVLYEGLRTAILKAMKVTADQHNDEMCRARIPGRVCGHDNLVDSPLSVRHGPRGRSHGRSSS